MKLDDPALLAQLGLIREQHAVYITEADNLQVTTWNVSIGATSVSITGRFLGVDGRIVDLAETHTPNTDRTSKSTIHALGEGWLLNLNIASNGAPLKGLSIGSDPKSGATFGSDARAHRAKK